MNRRGFGIVWGLVTLVVAGIVGIVAYNAGASSVVTSSAGEAGRVVLDLPAAVLPLHLLRPLRPVGEGVRPRRVVREGLRRPAVQARQLAPAGARHAGAQNW